MVKMNYDWKEILKRETKAQINISYWVGFKKNNNMGQRRLNMRSMLAFELELVKELDNLLDEFTN